MKSRSGIYHCGKAFGIGTGSTRSTEKRQQQAEVEQPLHR